MKKFLILITFFLILFTYFFNNKCISFYDYFKGYENASFSYILSLKNYQKMNNTTQKMLFGSKSLKNGTKIMVYCNNKIEGDFLSFVEYSQVSFKGDEKTVEKLLKKLGIKIVKEESFESKKIFYGYSCFWKNFKVVENLKINFQIVINKDFITVGYPMIYEAF